MKVIKQLSILAIFEGISYLLFGLTMPLKYVYEIGWPNRIIGMVHGVLFIAYCFWVVWAWYEKKLTTKQAIISGLASLLPFATFVVDVKILKPILNGHAIEK